jgi:hypothetical protein
MAAKIKYKLKQEKGVLHVGGGRFFYPGEIYDLTDDEIATYGQYFSEEQAAVLKKDEEIGRKAADNSKAKNAVNNEKATGNTENAANNLKAETEPAQKSHKPNIEKPEKQVE